MPLRACLADSIEANSASGPMTVVQDYYGNQVLASTEDLLSTSGWRDLLADFAAGPQRD